MSLKVTSRGPPIMQLSTGLKSAINVKSTFCSKFYQQYSETEFRTNLRQLLTNINLFSNIVNCFFYQNIYK